MDQEALLTATVDTSQTDKREVKYKTINDSSVAFYIIPSHNAAELTLTLNTTDAGMFLMSLLTA